MFLKGIKYFLVSIIMLASMQIPSVSAKGIDYRYDVIVENGSGNIKTKFIFENKVYTLYSDGSIDVKSQLDGKITEYVNVNDTIYKKDGIKLTKIIQKEKVSIKDNLYNNDNSILRADTWSGITKQKYGPINTNADEGLLVISLLSLGLGWTVGGIVAVASYIVSKSDLKNVYLTQDYKTYIGCSILAHKSNIKIYKYSNYTGLLYTNSSGSHGWLGDPWNYSYPGACRVAVQTYPQ